MRRPRLVLPAVVAATALLACGAAVTPPASAATGSPPPLSAVLRTATTRAVADGYPAAIAYARRGDVSATAAAGLADVATGRPARPGDRFRIASNTKSFVATVLLQLVAEHRLGLDDPVARWLPGVISGAGNDGRRITVRELLNQTSGLYDPTTDPAFFAPYLERHDMSYVLTPRRVVAEASAHRPLFAPGTRWNYSNTNYLVAGLVIEAVTGHSAGREITDRILRPLGLTRTTLPLTDPHIHGRHLHGYDLSGHDVTVFSPSYDWTAGAMISTLDDLAAFDRALFSGRLLPPVEQRALETAPKVPGDDGYALGVTHSTVDCGAGHEATVWETDGGGPGFTSLSLTSATAADRQLVLVGTVFDLGQDLRHQRPVPASTAFDPAGTAVFCH
ncbi:serine hydrolase domain-containing protein [Streptacidiphilus jiangxiensis]|uniref:D-alanyl-D-alanine carboxypeptidase n=1 Tax=Streptacidiphilus jiangxiensis TaxID=235985 RepID=A0A1H7V262_STRJI|nr:serine hydrolase domain-containing protein [Streptacidiphilus jiangxiensis]SEM03234.1 D-alanyl-D-alanine carboxypeptidase [Streptacidiphilus jiangxiensis]